MHPPATCPQCGSAMSEGTCSQCSTSNAPPWMTGRMPPRSRLWIVFGCGVAILLALLIGDFVVFRSVFRAEQRARRAAWAAAYVYPRHEGPIAPVAELKGKGRIYLVQMGPHTAPYSVNDLAHWLRTKYMLDVQVLPPMSQDPTAWDPKRKQYIAELLYKQIEREHPALAADPNAYLIGFTDGDMFSVYSKGTGSYTQRDEETHRAAIVSADGMEDLAPERKTESTGVAEEHLQARVRRILLKNVALLYWHLSQNNDPTSLLHQPINPWVPDDDIYESDLHPAGTRWGRWERNPTVSFTYSAKDGIQPLPGRLIRSWNAVAEPAHDESVELFQVGLRHGRLFDKHTDFYLPDTIPIRFQRVLVDGWTKPQAFGISGTDNYDKWLFTRDHMRHNTIMKANGNTEELVRTPFRLSGWWPILALDRWVDTGSGRLLDLRWHGHPSEHFELKRFDGEVESYLPCDDNTVCFQIGDRDAQGHALGFVRYTANRRLFRLTSPNKSWITLSYGKGPRIESITDSRGRTVRYGYNQRGQLTSVTYPDGEIYYYESDSKERLLTFSVAPDGKTAPRRMLTNEYEDGRLVKQTLSGGRVYSYNYSYNDDGLPTVSVTTPEGKIYDVDIRRWNAAVRERDPQSDP